MLQWLERLIDCWRLARQIQRGELVAVAPAFLQLLQRSRPDTELPPPVATQTEAESEEETPAPAISAIPAPFQVRLNRGGTVKVVDSGTEYDMKTVWRNYQPARPGCAVELFDVRLNLVRGQRAT